MIDTNVLISALAFPNSTPAKAIEKIIKEGQKIVFCDQIVDELIRIVKLKFPTKISVLKEFLENFNYELLRTPKVFEKSKYPFVRDPNDLPILISAIENSLDIILTGDKDLLNVKGCKGLKIISPSEYLKSSLK